MKKIIKIAVATITGFGIGCCIRYYISYWKGYLKGVKEYSPFVGEDES